MMAKIAISVFPSACACTVHSIQQDLEWLLLPGVFSNLKFYCAVDFYIYSYQIEVIDCK